MAFIPDEIRRCVVFLGYQGANQLEHVAGSAFWIIDTRYGHNPACLVTAAHVIDDIKRKSKSESVLMRFNYSEGNAKWVGMAADKWTRAPDADAAYLRIPIESSMDHTGIPVGMFLTSEKEKEDRKSLEIGDEVFFVGMFWPHHGASRNIPIVRVGNIASLREENVDTQYGPMDVYLVEARSVGGVSGSPVFIDILSSIITKELSPREVSNGERFRFVGLINGHFKGPENKSDVQCLPTSEMDRLNMGIAFMTPSEAILRGLSMFEGEDKKAEEDAKARRFQHVGVDNVPRSNVAMQVTQTGSDRKERV